MTKEEKITLFNEAPQGSKVIRKTIGNNFISIAKLKSNYYDEVSGFIKNSYGQNLFHIDDMYAIKPASYLTDIVITLGSDPELFLLDNNNDVVPSASVINDSKIESVAPDGFQFELHPSSHTCRESCGYYIGKAIVALNKFAVSNSFKLSFDLAHTISDKIWKNTPNSVKKFGCNPTENVHKNIKKISSGLRERFRAGGGHIHIGWGKARENAETLIKVLDIVAGNTCVLIDRDEKNAQRRLKYGRAGEYRLKPYGLEYRVLSNFWLRGYVAWSFASSLVRNAATIVANELGDELISKFDMKEVQEAINTNNYELALKNFLIYKKFLEDNNIIFKIGVNLTNIDKFLEWSSTKDPLSYINDGKTESIVTDWETKTLTYREGFENFISNFKK